MASDDPQPDEDNDPLMIALRERLPALERVLGSCEYSLDCPIPFYLGGKLSFLVFKHCPGITGEILCTNDFTGDWGSNQKTDGKPEFELLMVLPPNSPLAPPDGPPGDKPSVAVAGFAGDILQHIGEYTTREVVRSGDTLGPLTFATGWPTLLALFHELPTTKRPFEFNGRSYRLMLVILIMQAEARFVRKNKSAALIHELRIAGVFPYSDPTRESVV